jgi:hypothetical protein
MIIFRFKAPLPRRHRKQKPQRLWRGIDVDQAKAATDAAPMDCKRGLVIRAFAQNHIAFASSMLCAQS